MENKRDVDISVIMGIYNCAETLSDAIESIVGQSVKNWELIMCDDGSVDETFQVAESYQQKYPEQIILLKNEKNFGLNYTLNRCLDRASGRYIARMDGDDLCEPNRFELELAVLEQEPDIAIVSTDMAFFDESGTWGKISHPEYPDKRDFVHGSPFCHAPSMVRKEAYDAVGGYSVADKLLRVEDYHLWYKMYLAGYKGRNIHEILYKMRDDRNAYNRRKYRYRLNEAYVRWLVVKNFHLPLKNYFYILRPILVGLMPHSVYCLLHKIRLNAKM